MVIKTRSAKNKGKRLQNKVALLIRELFNLSDKDVKSTTMGESGLDIQLSEAAREKFPYAIECKKHARFAIYNIFKQAKANATKEKLTALLIIEQDRSEPLAILTLEDFLKLLK